jgi:diadenosine tetraphosphate (Ap4A) HIT family hydrolase
MTKNDLQIDCLLCQQEGGIVIWTDTTYRVIDAQDATYPGLTRVIFNHHVAEMTDLPHDERQHMMSIVCTVEAVVRQQLKPHKVNLASLGNYVQHLHWHVIPRWSDDATFPDAIWTAVKREGDGVIARQAAIEGLLPLYHAELKQRLMKDFGGSAV